MKRNIYLFLIQLKWNPFFGKKKQRFIVRINTWLYKFWIFLLKSNISVTCKTALLFWQVAVKFVYDASFLKWNGKIIMKWLS